MYSLVSRPSWLHLILAIVLFVVSGRSLACGQLSHPPLTEVPARAKPTDLGNDHVRVLVDQQTLFLELAAEFAGTNAGKVAIPRLCAPVRSMSWIGAEAGELQLHPEIQYWEVSWKTKPKGAQIVVIELDAPPVTLADRGPATPAADGSILLHAYQAETQGEKLRYEPQPYKNTVGYWVNPTDTALWPLKVQQPGVYRVAILQGCGKGQGGSRAAITIEQGKQTVANLDFETVETGHFQNFRWLDVGAVEINETGVMNLRLQPVSIKKAALLDVRMIHLVRQAGK